MQGRKKIKNLAVHLALICISFIIAFPFLWMFTNSIKTKDEIWAVPPKVLPAIAQWGNYADALADGTFLRYKVRLCADTYPVSLEKTADHTDHGDLYHAGYNNVCTVLCNPVENGTHEFSCGICGVELCEYF